MLEEGRMKSEVMSVSYLVRYDALYLSILISILRYYQLIRRRCSSLHTISFCHMLGDNIAESILSTVLRNK